MVKARYGRNQQVVDKDSIDVMRNMTNINKAKQYAWAVSHLYPDIYQPQRFPDQYRFPTHIMTNKFQRTLTIPSTKDFAIYFCPIADCFYNYKFNGVGQIYESLAAPWQTTPVTPDELAEGGISHAYISYADSDSKSTSVATDGKKVFTDTTENFANVINWNYSSEGTTSLNKFKKIRLIGAAIKITYTGKNEDMSGIVKASMGLKGFTTPLSSEGINTEELHNFPEYRSFTLEKPFVCRYRMTDDDFTEFGPYTPYSTLPFYIIYGKGLQEGSTVFVEVIKHFEGIVIPEQEEFVSPIRASGNQLPIESQLEFISNYKSEGHIDIADEESHKDLKSLLD